MAGRGSKAAELKKNYFAEFFKANGEVGRRSLVQIFKYLKMRELASAACVCRLWKEIVDTPTLWKSVRMKNSQVNDWEGLTAVLKRHDTHHLDLRKMLHQHTQEATDKAWDQFIEHVPKVDSLIRYCFVIFVGIFFDKRIRDEFQPRSMSMLGFRCGARLRTHASIADVDCN
jgi:hypothetical protein